VITPALIEAAASNQKYGRLVIDLLLEFQDSFMITKELVQLAAENNISGKEIIELILHKDNMEISEGAVAEIAAKFDIEIMRILMNLREDIKVTRQIMEAVRSRRHDRKEMMMLLLEHSPAHQVTEELIQSFAEVSDLKTMELVFEKQDPEFWITEGIIKAMAKNWINCNEIMALLLERRANFITITEETMSTIAENFDDEIMALLLDERGGDITITEKVVDAAVMNWNRSKEVLAALLSQRRDEVIIITMGVITAVSGNPQNSNDLMELLLDQHFTNITEEVIITILAKFDEDLLEIFLNARGDEVTITEEVIKAVAKDSRKNHRKIKILLYHRECFMIVTETVMSIIAANFDEEVMEILLSQRGNEITITQNIITAAAGNKIYGEEVIQLLLDERGNEITLTEEVITAAARNQVYGKKIIALLLDQRGDEITITENIMTAASESNSRVVELLLDQRGEEITITEKVIKAAVQNNNDLMRLLLDRRGDQIVITKEIIKAAANGHSLGMEYLLHRRGDEITITEEIIIIAASNNIYGRRIMELLLNQRGYEIVITEEVVKAAATIGNDEILDLLSKRIDVGFNWSKWRKISEFYNAARTGHTRCLKRLIYEGINPDMKTIYGQTPLHIAACNGYKGAVQVLAQRADVDVNSLSAVGRTPLFWPSIKGYEQITAILLEYGADPYIIDNDGHTAITVARQHGRHKIAQMLAQI
jgi:hypothetical protein